MLWLVSIGAPLKRLLIEFYSHLPEPQAALSDQESIISHATEELDVRARPSLEVWGGPLTKAMIKALARGLNTLGARSTHQ